MTLHKLTIHPTSPFGTPLKGDTLFGQLCWSIRYCYGEDRLQSLLQDYAHTPFAVVSDAFNMGYLPKPKLPDTMLHSNGDKKANRKKVWMSLEALQNGAYSEAKTARETGEDISVSTMHNAINYRTFTTDDKGFAPYGSHETLLCDKDIYLLLDDERIRPDEIRHAFTLMGEHGYGRDATIGKGRFEISSFELIVIDYVSDTLMALSPFFPDKMECKALYYEPFTRFGKKGSSRAHENPFKKPLLLCDTAGIVQLNQPSTLTYIGKGITRFSTHEDIVHQGYAIAIPIKEIG